MSSNNDFTTPEKKRNPSPPARVARKRLKQAQEAPTEDALLLIGDTGTYRSNHSVLSGITGHFGSMELFFLSDELFESVLGVVGGSGYSSVNRDLYFPEEIEELKKSALLKLFTQEIHGGGEAQDGQTFRGTIVM